MSSEKKGLRWNSDLSDLTRILEMQKSAARCLDRMHGVMVRMEENEEADVLLAAYRLMSKYAEQTSNIIVEEVLEINGGGNADAQRFESSPTPSGHIQ
ncbi:hypothetical protein JJB07_14640 [Tumebacillus sp. ITR2]|uniref:Uncharacterized protein n=1 Tax=Tumebacillus amylolyticus TaxID=2801339 RepID=A0ABS1JC79_9BACL|nr:hypothetical protein [Tumebacillus amylolyticus]MBL0387876.1 hypothetical protein [Tumebacillus amylolyticus]